MNRHWLRHLPLLLAALWLPLAAVAAVAMPFCGGQVMEMAHQATADHGAMDHHEGHHGSTSPTMGDEAPADPFAAGDCDQCGFCHLACSGLIAVTELRHATFTGSHVQQSRPARLADQATPEALRRPPRPVA